MEVKRDDWLKELVSILNVETPPASAWADAGAKPEADGPVVDLGALKRLRKAIGRESARLFDELVEILEQEALRLIPMMAEAARTANAAQLEYAAHTFKESGRNLGLSRLASLSRELELMGKAGDLSGAEPLVMQTVVAYQEALPALKNVLDDLPN